MMNINKALSTPPRMSGEVEEAMWRGRLDPQSPAWWRRRRRSRRAWIAYVSACIALGAALAILFR